VPGMLQFAITLALLAIAAAIYWFVARRRAKRIKLATIEAEGLEKARQQRNAQRDNIRQRLTGVRGNYGQPSSEELTIDGYTQYDDDREIKVPARGQARTHVLVAGIAAIALFLGAGAATAKSSYTSVPTKQIGVVTEFGRPIDSLDNGPHWKAPWTKITLIDGQKKTDSRYWSKDDPTGCTTVRIANQGTACVDNSIQWQITSNANTLFKDYGTFDNVRDSVITRTLGEVLNETFRTYDPFATDKNGNNISPTQDQLSQDATGRMKNKVLNTGITVYNVILPIEHFDAETQDRLNKFQAEVANTRTAKQKQLTATAEAQANNNIAASINNTPNVLVSKCLDTFNTMVNKNQPIPAGFSCWPSSGSNLVLPASSGTGK
jgi:hypothetical protein